jgi:uncharacterized zinc-type alcohol dehydrogenase-like protein
MMATRGYAAHGAKEPLKPFSFERREPGPKDVLIDILFCGICHSDIHTARGEWGETAYPVVPGHEIVGRVSRAGSAAGRFKPGDWVGVGCFVDSCRSCAPCREGMEQFCEGGTVFTYNSLGKDGRRTYGGYSACIVVDEDYVLRIPEGLSPERAAPLLCAGITTYSPLRHWKVGPGHRLGVLGLGGLGHMAVKLGASLGAEVTVFSSSPGKADEARRLGATDFVLASDKHRMTALGNRLDFLIDTVSAPHDLEKYLDLLARDGTLILVGAPSDPLTLPAFSVIFKRKAVAGSLIGGLKETQEMLDYCARTGVQADVEVIPMADVNRAYDRVVRGDVRYRFVIDMRTL